MKTLRTDARSRFTQAYIKKSLLKLIGSTPLKSITVAELCREAEITRSTFYNPFYDVYDVYESIENEFYEQMTAKLDTIKTYALDNRFFLEMLNLLAEKPDVTSIIVSNPYESTLLKRIISYVRDKYITEFSEKFPHLDKSVIETVFLYSSNGSVSVMADWFKRGMPVPPERIADFIGTFNSIIISGIENIK